MTGVDRFFAKVDVGDCWLWTASGNGRGYGKFHVDGTLRYAHRWVYEQLVGPVPAGLELDHLCRVPACVNPDHLEPVTHAENMRRGAPTGRRKTHCPQGHPYAGAHLYVTPDGRRDCRTCRRACDTRRRAGRAARSQEAAA